MNGQRIVWVVSTELFVKMLGVGMLTPVLPLYAQTFEVSTAMVGLIITVLGAARLIVSLPAGAIADRLGRRPLLILGPALVVGASLICAGAVSFSMLLLGRFIQGIGSALFHIVGLAIVMDVTTPEDRTRHMSIYEGAAQLGLTLGPVLGGFAATLWGYRAPFLVNALLCTLAALWGWAQVPETRPARPAEAPGHSAARTGSALAALTLPVLLMALVNLAAYVVRGGGQNTLLPMFGQQVLALETDQIGLAFTLMGAATVFSLYATPGLVKVTGTPTAILIGGLATGAALAAVPMVRGYGGFIGVCAAVGAATALLGAPSAAYAAEVSLPDRRGAALGWYRSAADLGLLLGPVGMGWAADWMGLAPAFWLNAGLLAVCLGAVSAMRRGAAQGKG